MNGPYRNEYLKNVKRENYSMLKRITTANSVVGYSFNDPDSLKYIRPLQKPYFYIILLVKLMVILILELCVLFYLF